MSNDATITPTTPVEAPDARGTLVFDAAERLFLLTLFGWLLVRLVKSYLAVGGIGNLIVLVSEGLLVLFILFRRRTTEISKRPSEWLLALGATSLPLLVTAGGSKVWLPVAAAATIMLMGILIQLHAKLTLARSFGMVPAHRGLKTSGPYRFVRHPMYAGYLLTHVGFFAWNPTWWNFTAYALCYALQIPRLLAEERFLSRDPAYREYQARVSYHIIPGLF